MLFRIMLIGFVMYFAGNVTAKELHCREGGSGGDNGYDDYVEIVISDAPIARHRRIDEADPGYRTRKGSQSASLILTIGWDNKELYGNDVVMQYPESAFAKKNYNFAKACMTRLYPAVAKLLPTAALNPKPKSKKEKR